jgi:ethanolamine ammonia-lyase small subunit
LARSGASLATAPLLAFRVAHAEARDAVHDALDVARLRDDLAARGRPCVAVASAAGDRRTYLMRPDLGRRLADGTILAAPPGGCDLAVVIADGLSARAAQAHAAPLVAAIAPALEAEGWRLAPPVIVQQGRVAIGDAVARALGASAVAILIGERPGLSSPDSLGAYLTWQPGPTTTDADRNCISNIRPDGVAIDDAAFRLVYLLRQMRATGLSGVALKDDSERLALDAPGRLPIERSG